MSIAEAALYGDLVRYLRDVCAQQLAQLKGVSIEPERAALDGVIRATLRYPGGNAGQQDELVTFGYNTVGQLNSVTSDDGTQYVASTTYNSQGQVTEQRLDSGANGFTRQSVYNANTLRLETLKAGTAAPFENLQKLAYAYDLAGNVQALTDNANSGQTQTFGYDWLDRLTSAATNAVGVGQYSHAYAYNAIGNLTSYNSNSYTYGTKPHAGERNALGTRRDLSQLAR